jgi:hypothetical protein
MRQATGTLKREIRQQCRNVSQDAEEKSATISYLGVEGDEFVVKRDVAPTLMGQLNADVGVGRRARNNCSLVLKKENFIIKAAMSAPSPVRADVRGSKNRNARQKCGRKILTPQGDSCNIS